MQTRSNDGPLYMCLCRGEENSPKDIEKCFFGFSLAREKLFAYPWELKEQKEIHPDQKLENIFYYFYLKCLWYNKGKN